jgi:hypothetical protein
MRLTSFSVRSKRRFSVPASMPRRAGHRGGQGWPKAIAQRREAPLTAASTARCLSYRDACSLSFVRLEARAGKSH